jgi:5-oxopent-3-ene-1,2,5-tricarboxylate decarboxylase/2-hydroxyhepta-2,4-diene-1,7-dioate isomerase
MRLARIEVGGTPTYCRVEPDGYHVLGPGEPETATPAGPVVPADQAALLPPVSPTKILAVLGAFPRDRSRQEARSLRVPGFTSKLTSCINAHQRPIVLPFDAGTNTVGEAEIGVVLARSCRRVSPAEARAAILGFTCVNDVTLAGRGESDKDFMRCKSVDTFGVFGPWIETELDPDRLAAGLSIRGYVNGVQTQEGNTRDFTYDVLETIAWASQFFTLRRFDLICLGTPTPPSPIAAGDEMTVTVDEVGSLTNPVVAESEPGPEPGTH